MDDHSTLTNYAEHNTASVSEVKQAIENLSASDAARLNSSAHLRMALLGPAKGGRTAKDLLQEAIMRTLSGVRRWKPDEVEFVPFLMGVMRSISSQRAEQHQARGEITISATGSDSGNDPARVESKSNAPDPERSLRAGELLAKVDDLFANDEDTFLVIQGWRDGMTGPEIQQSLGFSETKYETVARRIRRNVRKELGEEYGG